MNDEIEPGICTACGSAYTLPDGGDPWESGNCDKCEIESLGKDLTAANLQMGELETEIAQAYSKMGKYAHEALGWERKDNWTYAFSIGKFIEMVNVKVEEQLRLNSEMLKRVEEFKCSAKAEECTKRHFGYNLAIDDVLEILREPLKRVVSMPKPEDCPNCVMMVNGKHKPQCRFA